MNRDITARAARLHRDRYTSRLLLLVWAVAFLFFTWMPAHVEGANPQSRQLSIRGKVVSDSNGAVVGADIRVRSLSTSKVLVAKTSADGAFRVENLSPGSYEITVSATGYAVVQVTLTIELGKKTDITFSLVPSTQQQSSQSSNSSISGTVNSQTVTNLPLNGRSATDLAALEPGVATARTQTTGQAQRGFGAQMTISGSRPRQNDSRLDGISVNDYSNGPPGSALGVNLGADAVEQFSVLSSNYAAQYGRSSGGIIGASTRSGADDFHGSAFEFLRNSALDARNFFDGSKPPFRRNQFGGSIGGPILKDHTFFFVAYEGLRQSLGITQVDTVPSSSARAGQLSTGAIQVDPAVLRFLNAFYPLPNGPLLGPGDTGLYSFSGQDVTPENYFTTRIDHKFSERDTLSGTYMFDSGSVQQPDELNNKRTGYDSRRQLISLHEVHEQGAHWLNSFRFGASRIVANTGLTFAGGNPAAGDPAFGSVPGTNAAAVTVPGLTAFAGGLNGLSAYHFHWTSLQTLDDVSYTRGSHLIDFGFSLERIQDNILATTKPSGSFSFNSLQDFLLNRPFSFSATLPGTVSERGFRQTVFGAYIQDRWQTTQRLTLNFGLRYEMASVPTEVHGMLATLRNLTDASPHLGDPLFSNPTLHNFEPRVGLSLDPFGNGKTVVSAGFGIFDVLPLPYEIQMNELFSAPFFEFGNVTNLQPLAYPTGAFDIAAGSSDTFRQGYFEPHPRRNYVMQWNLTIRHRLPKDIDFRAAYVGSRGVHQPFRVEDADIVLPTLTSQGYLWPLPIGTGARLNPNAGRITAAFWQADSYYDALQIQVRKQFVNGLQFGTSYTWGKSIDTSSGSMVGDEYSNSISSPLWFDPRLNRGLSDFNVAQNLEAHFTIALPTPRLPSRSAGWMLHGWQAAGVFDASTGVPFTPGFAGDALGIGSTDPNIDVPNVLSASGCGNLVNPGNPNAYINTQCFAVPVAPPAFAAQCVPVTNPVPESGTCLNLRGNLGRNTLIGPGLVNLDFSLLKNNPVRRISDAFNIQFRAEFFNIINHTNFAPPLSNKNIFDSTGHAIANAGLIVSTQTPSRQIQFAIKVLW